MLKTLLTVVLFLMLTVSCFSMQQQGRDFSYDKTLDLSFEYDYNVGEDLEKDIHLIGVGVEKSIFGGMHGGGHSYGLGVSFGLNTEKFVIGPKIEGKIYYQFVVIGSEFVGYTDFDKLGIRYLPIFGIGTPMANITFKPHVKLGNRDFTPINEGSVNLNINLALGRKKQ